MDNEYLLSLFFIFTLRAMFRARCCLTRNFAATTARQICRIRRFLLRRSRLANSLELRGSCSSLWPGISWGSSCRQNGQKSF